MFDDNGDCLDPKLIDELTASVGKVAIEKPKSDYKVRFSRRIEILVKFIAYESLPPDSVIP